MNVTVLQESALKALRNVSRFTESKPLLPALKNVKLIAKQSGVLLLQATDMSVVAEVRLNAHVYQEGEVMVDAKVLTDLVSKVEKDELLSLSIEKEKLRLRSRKMNVSISLSTDEMPHWKFPNLADVYTLPATPFVDAYKHVAVSILRTGSQPKLAGAQFQCEGDTLYMRSADGYRMSTAFIRAPRLPQGEWIIPAHGLDELMALIDEDESSIGFLPPQGDDEWVWFQTQTAIVGIITISGKFPDFSKSLSTTYNTRVAIDTSEFKDMMDACSIYAKDSDNRVMLSVGSEQVAAMSRSQMMGETAVTAETAEVEGQPIDVVFNVKYVKDALSSLDATTYIETLANDMPILFKREDGFTHVVMPMAW